ncbi:Plasmodium exported protein, unknown function, partial [Plasmodium malariae]
KKEETIEEKKPEKKEKTVSKNKEETSLRKFLRNIDESKLDDIIDKILGKMNDKMAEKNEKQTNNGNYLRMLSKYNVPDISQDTDDGGCYVIDNNLKGGSVAINDLTNKMFSYPYFSNNFSSPMHLNDKKLCRTIITLSKDTAKEDLFPIWKLFCWNKRNKYVIILDELMSEYDGLRRNYSKYEHLTKRRWKKCYKKFKKIVNAEEASLNKEFISLINNKSVSLDQCKEFLLKSIQTANKFLENTKVYCRNILQKDI